MACWKCPACGQTVCDLEECPTCSGNGRGIKKALHDQKLRKNWANIDQYPAKALDELKNPDKEFFNAKLGLPYKEPVSDRCIVCGKHTQDRLIARELGKREIPFCRSCNSEGYYESYRTEFIYREYEG